MRRERLRAALLAHSAGDAVEAAAIAETLAALDAPADPFDRATLPGHVTGSAVIIAPGEAEVLLVWHRKLARWLQPGGHVDPADDSVFATARREVREETGLASLAAPWGERILHVDAHDIPARVGEPPHRHLDVRFLLTAESRDSVMAHDAVEVREARWFSRAALSEVELDESLARALARAWELLPARES